MDVNTPVASERNESVNITMNPTKMLQSFLADCLAGQARLPYCEAISELERIAHSDKLKQLALKASGQEAKIPAP